MLVDDINVLVSGEVEFRISLSAPFKGGILGLQVLLTTVQLPNIMKPLRHYGSPVPLA